MIHICSPSWANKFVLGGKSMGRNASSALADSTVSPPYFLPTSFHWGEALPQSGKEKKLPQKVLRRPDNPSIHFSCGIYGSTKKHRANALPATILSKCHHLFLLPCHKSQRLELSLWTTSPQHQKQHQTQPSPRRNPMA